MTTPFTAFNKIQPEPGALVGNWVEERSLMDKTGAHRGFDESLVKTLPKGTLPGPEASTFLRTIEHTERIEPPGWVSTQRDYRGRWAKEDAFRYEDAGLGPRERRELERLAQTAATLPPPPPPEHDLNSTQRTSFVPHQAVPYADRGKRVMKDRDGRPVSRDYTFLAETGLLPRAEADRHLAIQAGFGVEGGSDSDLSTSSKLSSTVLVTTGVTQPGHPNTGDFRRYAEFTRPMNDVKKAQVNGVWAREW